MIILWIMLGAGLTSLAYELLGARHAQFSQLASTRAEIRDGRVWLVATTETADEVAVEFNTTDAADEVGRALCRLAGEVRR